jgi:hypothetical protein
MSKVALLDLLLLYRLSEDRLSKVAYMSKVASKGSNMCLKKKKVASKVASKGSNMCLKDSVALRERSKVE